MKDKNLVLALIALLASSSSFADGLDFSAITGAVDASTIVAALGTIAGVMMLPRVAKWGYSQVMSMLGR